MIDGFGAVIYDDTDGWVTHRAACGLCAWRGRMRRAHMSAFGEIASDSAAAVDDLKRHIGQNHRAAIRSFGDWEAIH